MTGKPNLPNTTYDIMRAMGKEADFLYETIDAYIKDAQNANNSELAEIWQTIKNDSLKLLDMLKGALEKEIHG